MNNEHQHIKSPAMTAVEAARFLNISQSFLWELRAKYDIPFVKVGSRTLWLKRDLEDWLKARRITSPEQESHLYDGRRSGNKKRMRPIEPPRAAQNSADNEAARHLGTESAD